MLWLHGGKNRKTLFTILLRYTYAYRERERERQTDTHKGYLAVSFGLHILLENLEHDVRLPAAIFTL